MMIRDMATCFAKDFKFYFQSRIIYLLVFVYAALLTGLTLYASDFYNNTHINLYQFFKYQPGILMMMIPALTMRFWADEYKHNTLEVLLAQPISDIAIVLGKFLAAWVVVGVMLLVSAGFWVAVAQITELDNLWVLMNYLLTFWMAGSLCALSSMAAAFCYNALSAYMLAVFFCVVAVMINASWLGKWFSSSLLVVRVSKAFDFRMLFDEMIGGQISFGGLVYFGLLMMAALWLNTVAVEYKRS